MATAQGAFSRTRTGTLAGAEGATGTSIGTSSPIGAGEPTAKGTGTGGALATSVTTAVAFAAGSFITRGNAVVVAPATTTRAEAGARTIGCPVEGRGAASAVTAGTPTPTPSFRGRYGTGLGGPCARTRRNGRFVLRMLVARPTVRPPGAPVVAGARPIAVVGRAACPEHGHGPPFLAEGIAGAV